MPLGDSTQAGAEPNRPTDGRRSEAACPCWAEVVDAVVGGDRHRDTHALELTAPSGATIATLMIGNDERGYAEAIAWVAERAPGPAGGGRARLDADRLPTPRRRRWP
jgi:hypothetical protein